MGSYGAYLAETSFTLLAVCTLAFVALYAARRLGHGRSHGPVALCGQLALDARRSIYLVRVGTQVFVLGVAEGGFTKLGEIPADTLPAEVTPPPFGDVLARVLGRVKPPDRREARDDRTGGAE
jgi:flagellar biogenesis protein FliO